MANVRKKISELTALTSASLDTVIVGVDNGTTYKIELDVLADAVTSRVNILDRSRLSSLEYVTSSFEIKGRSLVSSSAQISNLGFVSTSVDISALNSYTSSQTTLNTAFTNGINARLQTSSFNEFSASVHSEIVAATNEQSFNGLISGSSQLTSSYDERYVISGSITQTTWDNISGKPSGLVSQSTDLSSINTFTQSIDSRVDNLESWSSSLDSTFATDLQVSIVSSSVAATIGVISQNTGLVSTSSFNEYTASQSTASLVDRLDTIENVTSSYETKGSGILSGSVSYLDLTNIPSGIVSQSTDLSQLNSFTQSIDSRVDSLESSTSSYLTTLDGAITSSSQLTSSFDTRYTLSGSVQPLPSGLISGSSQLTSSYDSRYSLSGSVLTSFSSSVDSRLDTLEASIITGTMNYTQVLGNRRTGITSVGTSIVSGSITATGNPVQIMVTGDANPIGGSGWARLQIFRDGNGIGNVIQVENSSNLNVPYCLNVIDTPSAGTYTYSMRTVDSMSGIFDFGEYTGPLLTAVELKSNTQLPSGLISGSSQLTSSYDTRYTLSGSVQPLPSGLISGSSQLTSSYDTRYTLSGSVVSGTTPAGTISGSSQISAFGFVSGSYTTTASFNSFTASAQAVTTGSNSFNGTQTITGSLIVTTGSFIGSQILANTSSLYLTSGSNMYVQNNGLVEITGSIVVSGSNNINLIVPVLQIGTGSGDEGGEIQLAKAVTNTTLTGSAVTVDIYRDRLRVFEQGGDARGVHIDLSKTPGGVAGELIWKVSGLVNAGTFVQLDNLKCTVTTSGNRGLSIGAVSTNFSANISAYYAMSGGMAGTATNNISYTTTASTSAFSWHFTAEGDGSYYTIVDKTNNRMYRVTLMIGASYNNNFISIERLY
jgi:hypothetical protein